MRSDRGPWNDPEIQKVTCFYYVLTKFPRLAILFSLILGCVSNMYFIICDQMAQNYDSKSFKKGLSSIVDENAVSVEETAHKVLPDFMVFSQPFGCSLNFYTVD